MIASRLPLFGRALQLTVSSEARAAATTTRRTRTASSTRTVRARSCAGARTFARRSGSMRAKCAGGRTGPSSTKGDSARQGRVPYSFRIECRLPGFAAHRPSICRLPGYAAHQRCELLAGQRWRPSDIGCRLPGFAAHMPGYTAHQHCELPANQR